MASITCAPSGWPACLRSSEIGPCAILLMMPRVSASQASSCSGVSGPNLRRILFDLARADLFQLLLQADDGRRDLLHLEPRHHALHFLRHDRLGVLRLLHALAQVGVDHFLQIVDVVQEDVVEIVDGGLDIARHRDIDQEHRLVAARGDDALHLVLVQDVMRRAARGDQDIHLGQHADEARILDRRALEQLRHFHRALVRAVGDEDVRRARAPQVARRQFGHLARARRS